MKYQFTSGAMIVALLAIVAGAVWFQAGVSPASEALAADPPPAPAATQPTTQAQKGELCPEPPRTATRPTTGPASQPTTQPAAGKLPRVVDLGADKCKACKDLAPILAQLKKEYEGRVTVEFIDVWKNPKAGEPYNIKVIPTQVFFDRDGKEVWRHVGFLPKADFIAKFKELGVK